MFGLSRGRTRARREDMNDRLEDLKSPEFHLKYWDGLLDELNRTAGCVSGTRRRPPFGKRTPAGDNWMDFAVGKDGFSLFAKTHRKDRWIHASLYIYAPKAGAFDRLKQEKHSIEYEVGCSMIWDDGKPAEREIGLRLENVDLNDQEDWPRQHRWFARRLNRLYTVFRPRVR